MENRNIDETSLDSDNEILFLKNIFHTSLDKWYWYAISVSVAVILFLLYIFSTPPTFSRYASVLITDERNDMGAMSAGSMISDITLGGTGANVNNELIAFQSPDLMTSVVQRLNLDITYRVPSQRLYKKTLYGSELPFSISFPDLDSSQSVSLKVEQLDKNKLRLSKFTTYADRKNKYKDIIECNIGETVSTPLGRIRISRNLHPDSICKIPVFISKIPVYLATEASLANLTASLESKKSTVIRLQYNDENMRRAEDIINTLIALYNENRITEKNQKAISTSAFINDRLAVIERDLSNVDKEISVFKSENLIPDLKGVSEMYMDQAKKTSEQLVSLNMQLAMASYIKDYMLKAGSNTLLPANTGIESNSIESQISEYNQILLKRNSLSAKSSPQNPLVIDMDKNIQSLRNAINTSIDNLILSLNTKIENLEREERKNINKIADNPIQANYLLSVERQQKIKESLYLYLLQQREENELSQTFTPYNTRIITTPSGSMRPVAPRKFLLLIAALAFGMIVPAVGIYLKLLLTTTIQSKKDIEWMSIPLIGEIPLINYRSNKKSIRNNNDNRNVVVEPGNHNAINEAFRIVRTNLEFTAKQKSGNIIMFTSSLPDSGKTFINKNLAKSFALKGKHVLIIDLDMRKATLSNTLGLATPGMSDYLAGMTDDIDSIIKPSGMHPEISVIPVGTIPPNPSELLSDDRMKTLVGQLKPRYDYIFLDCPPAGMLADTDIINQYTDYTVYIIRIGNMDKQHLPDIERLYRENKFNNMTMILNGIEAKLGRYGTYRGYGSYSYYGGGRIRGIPW